MTGADLFDYTDRYPHRSGFKERGGTSEAAAEDIAPAAQHLRGKVLDCLRRHGPRTADECASLMGEELWSVRPRLSELGKRGLIAKTGERRPNRSGSFAAVWRARE
jgi:hypothetical protein